MTLQAKLDATKQGAMARIPADELAATDSLRNSGIPDGVIAVGSRLPPFALSNQNGAQIRSEDLFARGAVVLTVFRGHWCPYCNAELYALRETLSDSTTHGATLVALTPQLSEFSASMVQKHRLVCERLGAVHQRQRAETRGRPVTIQHLDEMSFALLAGYPEPHRPRR